MTKTATLVRKLDWNANAALYKLSEPVSFHTVGSDPDDDQTTGWVIASAVVAFDTLRPECLIFPAKEDGETWSMLEIAGLRGTLSHEEAFETMGFGVSN